jgi:amidophosphoribosyltransferase
VFPCNFHNFSTSRSTLELASRKAIQELKGDDPGDLEAYIHDDSDAYGEMVEQIRRRIGATSLKYQTMGDLLKAIGLPFDKLCTHCWDNSSYF